MLLLAVADGEPVLAQQDAVLDEQPLEDRALVQEAGYSWSVQKPITRSTPARLYQLRSNSTISPAAGRCSTYRWKYHWVRCRSVGAGSATIRATRGLRYSVTRLIVLPLPAASRPSKTTTSRAPSTRTHSCNFTSSACRRRSSRSYTFFGNRLGDVCRDVVLMSSSADQRTTAT